MSDQVLTEIKKLKYHISLLAETIDDRENPIPSLVIRLDWDDKDLNAVHDIFEKYDKKLEAKDDVNWTQFEMELREAFKIGYQTVKSIILAFYRNHQWTEVCTLYAMSHMCAEFHEIARDKK